MNCQEFRERIVDPSSSSQGGHAPIVEHLQECPDCRAQARNFAGIERLLRAAPDAEPPEDFDERVRKRMARATPADRAFAILSSRRVLGAGAVVVLLVAAGLLIRKPPAPVPSAAPPAVRPTAAPPARDARPPDILAVRSTPITLETTPAGDEEEQRILALHDLEYLGFVETLARLSPLFPADIGPSPPETAVPPQVAGGDDAEAARLADWRAASRAERDRWQRLEASYASRSFAERRILEERWRRVQAFSAEEKAGLNRLAGRFAELDDRQLARFESELRAIARLVPSERRIRWRAHPFVRPLTGQEIAIGEKLLLSR